MVYTETGIQKNFSERWNCSLFWPICKNNVDSKAAKWTAADAVPSGNAKQAQHESIINKADAQSLMRMNNCIGEDDKRLW